MTLENLTIAQLRCVEGLCTCGAFERAFKVEPRPPVEELIIDRVCVRFGVTRAELVSPKRTSYLARVRWVAMYLLRRHTLMSLEEIGSKFHRDHGTVIHGLDGLRDLMASMPSFAHMMNAVESDL